MVLSSYKKIDIDGEMDFKELQSGSYIWLIHADKIPPHIGFSIDGSYYSLKGNGVDFDVDVDSVIRVIQKKKIKTLFFQVENAALSEVKTVFSKYKLAKANEVTCLAPVKELMHFTEAKRIHDLIDWLDQKRLIQSCRSLHVSSDFKGLVEYSEQDIHNRLKRVHEG